MATRSHPVATASPPTSQSTTGESFPTSVPASPHSCAPHHPSTSPASPCSWVAPDPASPPPNPPPQTPATVKSSLPITGSTLSLSRSSSTVGWCSHKVVVAPTNIGVPGVPHVGQLDGSHVLLHGFPPSGCLSMPEIKLHVAINVVSHLNVVEEARSLSVKYHSLREFLLDQIFLVSTRVMYHTSSRTFLVTSWSMLWVAR
jgi:hypothetical protein